MAHEIKVGQTYRAVKPNLYGERVRIVVTAAPAAGSVFIGTLGEDGRVRRGRRIRTNQLHQDILTKDGKPRRNGYALEE